MYWFFPYPNQRELWMNFKSPAHVGRVRHLHLLHHLQRCSSTLASSPTWPSCATTATGLVRKRVYNILVASAGAAPTASGTSYMAAYGFFAAFAAPLVLSVHSVV